MDPKQFDQFARLFARDVSRRTAVRRFGASIATAAVAAGLPVGRVLAQQEGDVGELPPGIQPLRGACQLLTLGCRDFDGDGICTSIYLTSDCQVVEGGECSCPPPSTVGSAELAANATCSGEGLACYEDCHGGCVESGARPPVCARTCARSCGCTLTGGGNGPVTCEDNSVNHNICMAAAWTFQQVCRADCVVLSAACGPLAPACLATCFAGCDQAVKDYNCPPKVICHR
jgi:hypothetical protein